MDDDDLQQRLRRFAEEASPRPGAEAGVLRKARARRRLTAAVAALSVVAVVGGVAGAVTLLGGDDRIDAAPEPGETEGCVSVGYDLAVGVPEGASRQEVEALGKRLDEDNRITKVWFVSAERARNEYLSENPDHEGRLPSASTVDQYRLTLQDGIDRHGPIARELASVGAGAYGPALRCPPPEPDTRFARYFFEVEEGTTSAGGVLEVDWNRRELCLQLQSRNIQAVHLLFTDSDDQDGRGTVVFTFFDPADGEVGSRLAPNGTHCFPEGELGEFDDDLFVRLLDEPERFTIDFHRGPNDEPGLVAELIEEPSRDSPNVIQAQGGTVRLEVRPSSYETGIVPRVVLVNDTDASIGYGGAYELEWRTAAGWRRVKNEATNCVFTSELIKLAADRQTNHVIGSYDRHCGVMPLPPGTYRVTKDIELESRERHPLSVEFEVEELAAGAGSVDGVVTAQ